MEHIYILLLGLIIYYIISRFYEKYTENFDPSLVPVSSIVTLAKVAQKLVDGNGTLTNPGNLTLGTPNAKGNLLVTGDSTTTGNTVVSGLTDLKGNTTIRGQADFKNSLYLYSTNNDQNTIIHSANDFTRVANKGGESIIEFKQDKNVIIPNGNLTVNGSATIGTSATTNNMSVNGISGSIVPSGGIILWSGAVANIPAGWALCNGANGTPNLQDKFIVGAGSNYAVNAIGGDTAHTHGVSNLAADLAVGWSGNEGNYLMYKSSNKTITTGGVIIVKGIPTWTGSPEKVEGGLNTVSISGPLDSSNNLPPYYALCYIMKI